jgi:hypothetical protein
MKYVMYAVVNTIWLAIKYAIPAILIIVFAGGIGSILWWVLVVAAALDWTYSYWHNLKHNGGADRGCEPPRRILKGRPSMTTSAAAASHHP